MVLLGNVGKVGKNVIYDLKETYNYQPSLMLIRVTSFLEEYLHYVPQEHSRFVNCVRFSPDGALLASVSSDGKAVLYDGSTGETKCSLGGDKAHGGGIYAVSVCLYVRVRTHLCLWSFMHVCVLRGGCTCVQVAWGPDSKQLLTASGDKTCKLWDATTCQAIRLVFL